RWPPPCRLRARAAVKARRRIAAQRRSAPRHSGTTGRCRRSDAAGNGEADKAGGAGFVGWARRSSRRAHRFIRRALWWARFALPTLLAEHNKRDQAFFFVFGRQRICMVSSAPKKPIDN